jgi:SSS family solute:Na+ symporter
VSAVAVGPVVVLFLALTGLGIWGLRRRGGAGAFFLAGRRLPWWLVAFALAASEISALSVIGVPAVAYRDNWQYLQFFVGAAAARLVVAFWFYPRLRESAAPTVYGWLGSRFGRWTQSVSALLFIPTRLLAASVRLMIACAAASLLLEWRLLPTLSLTAAVGTLVAVAGLRAVVIANVVQFGVLLAAGAAGVLYVGELLQGGVGEIFHTAESAGRLGLWAPGALWSALIYGFCASLAVFGADQEIMQPVLAARSQRSGQRAMIWSIALSFAALLAFLLLGTLLFVFYEQHPEMALPSDLDAIVAHFARQNMTPWMRGVLAAGVLAASIDLPALSLATSWVHDLYRPLLRPRASERHLLIAGRIAVVVFGVLCAVCAAAFSQQGDWMWLAFKIGGVTFGPLLAMFLMGLLTRWHIDRLVAFATVVTVALSLWLLVLVERQVLPFDWGWLVPLGLIAHVGLCRVGLFFKRA